MPKTSTEKKNILTSKGLKKLQAELDERLTKIRTEIANKLEIATEQGDLSENAAYKGALEEKEINENRIEELESLLANSEVQADDDSILVAGLGDEIVLQKLSDQVKLKLTLVGKSEANPLGGMVSIESPLGKAVYNKAKNTKILVKTPNGVVEYKLLTIK